MIKSTTCSFKRPRLNSQHLHSRLITIYNSISRGSLTAGSGALYLIANYFPPQHMQVFVEYWKDLAQIEMIKAIGLGCEAER